MSESIKFIELFAGIGGFRYGLERVCIENKGQTNKRAQVGDTQRRIKEQLNPSKQRQFTCVYANEWDKYAAQIYKKHYGEIDTRDITTVKAEEIPDHDLLVGGFPCQAFSVAGKRRGFEDTRGTLFFEIARILKEKRPKYLLLENVKGLLSSTTPLPFEEFLLIFSEEVALEDTIKCNDFVPINSWEILAKNLGAYLNQSNGLDGLIGRLIFLKTQTEQIMKKPENLTTELMRLYECKEEEWDSLLNQLSSKESLKTVDISMLEKAMVINGDAVLKLRKRLGVSLNPMKLSTTLTELKLTTDQRTYISAIQELSIILFIIKQWKLSTSLWNKIKLFSKKGSIYYVKTFNIILHELSELGYDCQWQVLNSKDFNVPQNRERVFIIGHLRGTSRPEVFPITGGSEIYDDQETAKCLTATNYKGIGNDGTTCIKINQLNKPTHSNDRVYGTDGIGPTLNTMQGGNRQPFIAQEEMQIRRLTPTECERLQGFPDGWTAGVSDTQRYKCLGNAVTTNVITAIGEKLC